MFNFLMSNNEKSKKCESVGRRITEEMFGFKYLFYFTQDPYKRHDFVAISKNGFEMIIGDIKCYRNPEYPRYHNMSRGIIYPDFQLDYKKLKKITDLANEAEGTPIIIAHFTDVTMVWDLNKCDWKNRVRWAKCNDTGVDYGKEKTESKQSYLKFEEAIYIKDNKTGKVFKSYKDWKKE